MMRSKLNTLLFRIILFVMVIAFIEIIGYAGMFFSNKSFDFLANNNYFRIRDMLIGNKTPEQFPRYLSLPYLGYVPYPGYKKYGVVQHNEDGYRGNRVPLQKTDKFRVLCVGGSTTYGFTVELPTQTFPSQLENLLNTYIRNDTALNKKYSGAEVINAGIEAGNSAEELQQYLFKYRHYHPDAVIVHSGVNDAFLLYNSGSEFQLDYTHARRINFHLEPLPLPGRWLLKSYFISFLSIRFFYHDFAANTIGFEYQSEHTFCKWSKINMDSVIAKKQYRDYPFYTNAKSLYSEILSDSSVLLVLPTVLNKKSDFVKANKKYDELNTLNISLSKLLCTQLGGIFVALEYDSIKNSANWMDDCHLNSEGEKNKADILFPYLVRALISR